MTDVFTKEKRSWIMSRIRGKNTKIENLFESMLKKEKIKFRKYPKILKSGNPDFLIGNIAIFIDGCFWHKCPRHYKDPKSRKNFWILKIKENVKRDKEASKCLRKDGYKVIRFWEHDIEKNVGRCIKLAIQKSKDNHI